VHDTMALAQRSYGTAGTAAHASPDPAIRLVALEHMVRSSDPELANVGLVLEDEPQTSPRLWSWQRDGDETAAVIVGMGQAYADVMLAAMANPGLAILRPGAEVIMHHEKGHTLGMQAAPEAPLLRRHGRSYFLSEVAGEFTAQQYAFSRMEEPADAFAAMLVIFLLARGGGATGFRDVSDATNQQGAYWRQVIHFSREFLLEQRDSREGHKPAQRPIMALLTPKKNAGGCVYEIYGVGGLFQNSFLGRTAIERHMLPPQIQSITQMDARMERAVLEKTLEKAESAVHVLGDYLPSP